MDKNILAQYLEGYITAHEFSESLHDEITDYKNGLKKKGSSVHIKFYSDFDEFFISQVHYDKIYSDFINEKLDKYLLSYISDALLLSEKSVFENEDLIDKFESLSLD